MEINPFEIKDICRNKLTKYLTQAISILPGINKPLILDIGCGSGVPAIALSKQLICTIYAVDKDEESLSHFEKKINRLNLHDKIVLFQRSVFEMNFPDKYFDIVVAEGLLNIIGFEEGLSLVNKYIKDNGFFLIHDEYDCHEEKLKIIEKMNYKLINSIMLDEHVWWEDYYQSLEEYLSSIDQDIAAEKFNTELKEIKLYKEKPLLFRSIYYVLEK